MPGLPPKPMSEPSWNDCAFLKNWKMDSFADDIIIDRVTNSVQPDEV
jgi:hypothetical protein